MNILPLINIKTNFITSNHAYFMFCIKIIFSISIMFRKLEYEHVIYSWLCGVHKDNVSDMPLGIQLMNIKTNLLSCGIHLIIMFYRKQD